MKKFLATILLSFNVIGGVFAQSSEPLSELTNQMMSMSTDYAQTLTTGQWYVMFDRGTQPNKHGYVYERASSHTLYNTATAPNGMASANAHYLMRLVDAGDGKFYIQTGLGNYIGTINHRENVPVTAQPQEKLIVEKIAATAGHFYVQSSSTNVVLNANDVGSGDATVVGWNSTVPTEINGNNDFAFFPVTLTEVDESIALFEGNVTVKRGYQTCGRGNTNSLMLRMDVEPIQTITDATFTVSLNATTRANISSLYIYETNSTEFIANIPSSPLGTTDEIGSTASVNIGRVTAGKHYFWLCATVKDDAELEKILEANLTKISYTCAGKTNELNVASVGKPARQGMKVFDQQHFVFRPTSDNCRFYRIPAMIVDQNGDIVVSIDKRYNSNADLGGHKIDVISMRSEDGGRTWKNKVNVAVGDGYTMAYYGYGDPGLARAENGDLICLMAAGSKRWGADNTNGMKYTGLAISSNNGKSWTLTKNLFDSSKFYDEYSSDGKFSMSNYFTTSGKGLTTNDGVIMFATNCRKVGDGTNLVCIIYSTDNGNSWRLSKSTAYTGGDESKLEQLNDGSLLLSVRQSGNRGWNTATYSKNADGTVTFKWGSQYRTDDIWGNACNADILYYKRRTVDGKDIMLHSYINTNGRESLQMTMSLDGGKSWTNVYNIQPNGSCYSTMVKLPNGNVALLYEDESYSADNGYAINFVTITEEQILAWYDEIKGDVENPTVKVVEHGNDNGSAPWVTWQETITGNWAKKFTTTTASGLSGVVVTMGHNAFNRQTSYGQRVVCIKPSAAGAQNDVFTITAPEGYLIENYSIGGYFNTSAETYTLTAENGSSVELNKNKSQQNPPNFLTMDVNAKSTTVKMSNNNSTNNSYAIITQFIVKLKLDDTSTIGDAIRHEAPADNAIYDLQGRRVTQSGKLPKGIYVQQGRKFVVK